MSHFEAQKTYALFSCPANKKIIAEIEQSGASALLFPALKTEGVILSEEENPLKNLAAFDWIIFPDIFSVDYFLQVLVKLEADFFELDAVRICAFGETVADRLRFSQIHSDVISNSAKTAKGLQALKDYEPDFEELSCLILSNKDFDSEIAKQLTQTGAKVLELPIYQTDINNIKQLPKLKALLKGGAIDEFIFNSPEEASYFALMFQIADFSHLLSETIVSAANSQAYSSLREFGLNHMVLRK